MRSADAPAARLKAWPARILAVALFALGLILLVGGARLLWLGGSAYYGIAGCALLSCAVLLWRRRPLGAVLYAIFLLGTLLWSLAEAGFDGWAIAPRLGWFLLLGWLLALFAVPRRGWRIGIALGFPLTLLAGVGIAIALSIMPSGGMDASVPAAVPVGQGDWPQVAGTSASRHYSPAAQITPANVGRLEIAWVAHLGYPAGKRPAAIEATPIKLGRMLYVCDTANAVLALDADTGKVRWRFDPQLDRKAMFVGVCRGVASYHVPGATGLCADRIITATLDARMFALDALTGRRCPDFGHDGEISLRTGMGDLPYALYLVTSAPTIVRGRVVIGGWVLDGQETGEPSGVIRAFDAVSGALSWAWDMAHPERTGLPPPGQSYTRGTPNSWAPMSADEGLGLVYVPTGNATPDYVAAHRPTYAERYSSAVIALDAATGRPRWSYQMVHRDVWDYDTASPPALVEWPTAKGAVPALVQGTKRGEFFVLDRRTGVPLVETVERRVPGNPVPGERVSPTQPYPIGMPSFSGGRLTEADMWGISPLDQLWCRIRFREARYEGAFTPIGLQPTIVYPGFLGGAEWGGVAVDPVRRLLLVNVNHFANYSRMVRRPDADRRGYTPRRPGEHDAAGLIVSPQRGTPYANENSGFASPLGVPCTEPPFGEIAAIDMTTRKTVWRKPLGTARDSGLRGIPFRLPINLGTPTIGGALATGSGLTFIAATQEKAFRAFDSSTGKLLWYRRLPAGGHANPMTYTSDATGRQYVVVAASGHFALHDGPGDAIIAYALPRH
jgi:quinoprotein glucose dehydrogenase